MLIGNSIFGMAVKSTIFHGEIEMDNIAGIGNRYIPNPSLLNLMDGIDGTISAIIQVLKERLIPNNIPNPSEAALIKR